MMGYATMTSDEIKIEGNRCVYCGATVSPRLSSNGNTYNLDHFIPQRTLAIARKYHDVLTGFKNYLLPACGRCNNFAGEYVFKTMVDKVDFVRRQTSKFFRTCPMPQPDGQLPEILDCRFSQIVRPIEELYAGQARIIPCPERTPTGWRYSERIIPLCSLTTHFMALSKTGRSYSAAMS
jgi:hypothetical protein